MNQQSDSASVAGFELHLATEDDLPALVDVQQETFKDVVIEQLVNPDRASAAYRQRQLDAHLHHIRNDPGVKIVKVVVQNNDTDLPGTEETTSSQNSEHIVAFCMFYLPQPAQDNSTQGIEYILPLPLRPRPLPVSFPHITDPTTRTAAETVVSTWSTERQAILTKLVTPERPCGFVRYMCVLPAYRRRGIGHMLMRYGCGLFDAAGVSVFLEASAEGEGLYRWYGFEEVGSQRIEVGGVEIANYKAMWRARRDRL